MDEQLQHDPKTKHQIKNLLYDFMYGPVQKRFKERLDQIILKNSVLIGASHHSFVYKGDYYACDNSRPPRKMNRLQKHLHPEMDEYLKDVQELNNTELPYVLGFINQVLNASNELHDYLKVLPVSAHPPIEQIIATCPCRTRSLSPEAIQQLQEHNQAPIQLIKKRLMLNLIL